MKRKLNKYKNSGLLTIFSLDDFGVCEEMLRVIMDDDHLRRVRFNSASITVKDSQTGEPIFVQYFIRIDFFNKKPTYQI